MVCNTSVFSTSPSGRASRAVLEKTATFVLAAALVLISIIALVENDPGALLESNDRHVSLPLAPLPRRLKYKPENNLFKTKRGKVKRKRIKDKIEGSVKASSSSETSKSKSETLYRSLYTIPVVIECDATDDAIKGKLTDAFTESFGCVYNALACDKRKSKYYSQIELDSVFVKLDVHGSNCGATTTHQASRRELRRRTANAHISSLVASGPCDSDKPVCESEGAPLVDDAVSRVLDVIETRSMVDEYSIENQIEHTGIRAHQGGNRNVGVSFRKKRCLSLPNKAVFESKVMSRVRETSGIGVYLLKYETDACALESPGAPDPASEKTYKNKPQLTNMGLDCDIDANNFGIQFGCALERAYNEKACNDKTSEFFTQILITNTTVVEFDDSDCKRRDLLLEVSAQGERKLGRRKRRVILDAEAEVASGSCDSICDDEGAPLFDESVNRRRRDLRFSTNRCTKLPNKEEVEQEAINKVNTVTDIDAELITNNCDSTDGTYDYEFNFVLRLDCSDKNGAKLDSLDQLFACALVNAYNAEACNETVAAYYSQLVGGIVTMFRIPDNACDSKAGNFTIQGKVTGSNGLSSEDCKKNTICNATNAIRDEKGGFLFGNGCKPCTSLPSIDAVKKRIILALQDDIGFETLEFVTTSDPNRDPVYTDCKDNNPCTKENIMAGNLYHSDANSSYFVQCTEDGRCFERPCAPGTKWNQSLKTCAARF